MPSNRFDTSQEQQYVSSYIPLPFEAIGNLGAKITQDHNNQQAEADAFANALDKIKVTNNVISEGSDKDLGIKSRSTGYLDYKNQVLNKYTQANKQLADDYQAGKLDSGQFSQKVNQLKSDFGGDYQKLKIAEANSAAIEDADKKYRDNKDAGINPHLLNQMAEEGANLLKNPYGYSYKGAPIGEALDLGKKVNDYSDNYADQVLKSGTYKDKNGYIIRDTFTGVDRNRILDNVNRTFDSDSQLVNDYKEQTRRQLLDRGVDLNSKEGNDLYNNMMNNHKANFAQAVVDKAERSLKHQNTDKDWQAAKQMDWRHQEEVAKAQTNLVGNALPGSEINIFAQDPETKDLLDKGIIKVDNGLATLDYSALNSERSKTFIVKDSKGKTYNFESQQKANDFVKNMSTSGMKFSGITQKENTELDTRVDKFLEKAAKIAGIPSDKLAALRSGNLVNAKGEKISWSSMSNNILNAYNRLSKVRMGGVELPAAVQEIESEKVSASPSSYDVFDPINYSQSKVVINKGDNVKVGERVYKDGKAFDKAVIQRGNDADGNPITETVLLKPKSLEKSDYFDRGVGATQNAIVDLTVYGGDVPKTKLASHIQGYNPNLTGAEKIAQDSNLFHVKTSFDDDNNPLTPGVPTTASTFAKGTLSNTDGKQVSYQFVKNDDDQNNQAYLLFVPGKEEPLSFNDYSQFLVHADAAYYLYGQGKNDAAARLNKHVYEQMLSSVNNEQD